MTVRTRRRPGRGGDPRHRRRGTGSTRRSATGSSTPSSPPSRSARGTGLGLSISYGIVQSHGGSIAVESTSGRTDLLGATALPHLRLRSVFALRGRWDRCRYSSAGRKREDRGDEPGMPSTRWSCSQIAPILRDLRDFGPVRPRAIRVIRRDSAASRRRRRGTRRRAGRGRAPARCPAGSWRRRPAAAGRRPGRGAPSGTAPAVGP